MKKDVKSRINSLTDAYHNAAGLQFPMMHYDFYEFLREEGDVDAQTTREYCEIIKDFFAGEATEVLQKRIHSLRNRVCEKAEAISVLSDRFGLIEYVINRLELRFLNDSEDKQKIDDNKEVEKLMGMLLSDSKQEQINLKIQLACSQLPIRMTKSKFFSIIEESLTIYENAEMDSFTRFLYLLRGVSGLLPIKHMDSWEDLLHIEKEFLQLSYKEMDEDTYFDFCEKKFEVESSLSTYSDYYVLLAETINQLYLYLFTLEEASKKAQDKAKLLFPISEFFNEQYLQGTNEELSIELYDLFPASEGKLEEWHEEIEKNDSVISMILDYSEKQQRELGIFGAFDRLEKCSLLYGSSIFASLEEEPNIEPVSASFVSSAGKLLCEEIEKQMEGKEILYKRAIMAAMLKELPIFLTSREELEKYLLYSLENCMDYSEKKISLDLTKQALEDFL